MSVPTIICEFDGKNFVPLSRFHNLVAANFVIGQRYVIEPEMPRSMQSHRHQWPALKEAWMNLPESIARDFPTDESLRKRGLIECGYFVQNEIVCASKAEAVRWMTILRKRDEHAVYSIDGSVIVERVAKSQSMRAMPGAEFNRSKQAILEWAWGLCGLKPDRGSPAAKDTEADGESAHASPETSVSDLSKTANNDRGRAA